MIARATEAIRRAIARVAALFSRGTATHRLGLLGEAAAESHLRALGFRVLARRALVPMGEADLVCEAPPDHQTVVIVEVKTRALPPHAGARAARMGPEQAVGPRKRAKLLAIAAHLRRANQWQARPVRIDLVAVDTRGGRVVAVRHFPGIT
ncbi:MAG: YraN family protein [Phycisphaerales bacterium]